MFCIKDVLLRPAKAADKDLLWCGIFLEQDWKALDAPYFPLEHQSKFQFGRYLFKQMKAGESAKVIEYKGKVVGYVSYYWEDQNQHWLEIGITIFQSKYWGKHIGRQALMLWVTELFARTALPRIGLTTWSGNQPMIRCANAIGMRQEGCLRQVRLYQGQYYDALRYGVLRSEWRALYQNSAVSQLERYQR